MMAISVTLPAAAAAGGAAPFPGTDQVDHHGGNHCREHQSREEGPSVDAEKVKHRYKTS